MALGDSVPLGYPVEGGYRSELATQLGAEDLRFRLIGTQSVNASPVLISAGQEIHEGHNGYKIAEIGANLTANDGEPDNNGGFWLRRAVIPKAILLMIGTNDILEGNSLGMAGRLDALIGQIFAELPSVHLFLSNILPLTSVGKNSEVQAYNTAIRDNITSKYAALGRRIIFVDQYANFVDPNGNVIAARLPDGIHPDQVGYAAMGSTWARAVATVPTLQYERWRRLKFDATQAASDAISGADIDYDGDGLPNGAEFYYDQDPLQGEAAAGPIIDYEPTENLLTWTWRRNDRAVQVRAEFETSATLLPNSWQPLSPILVESLSPAPSTSQARFRATFDSSGTSPFFLRQVFSID